MNIKFKAKYSYLVDENIKAAQKLFKKKFNEEIEIISDRIYCNDEYEQMRELEISEPLTNKKPNVRYLGTKKYQDDIPVIYEVNHDLKLYEQKDRCDHCKKNRKRHVYHFFEDHGTIKMIGSNCSEEYFGINFEAIILKYWSFIQELIIYDELEDDPLDGNRSHDLDSFINSDELLAITLYCIKKFGFTSKQNEDPYSGRISTATTVTCLLTPANEDERRTKSAALIARDDTLIDNIKAYILEQTCAELQDSYSYNLRENWSICDGQNRHLRKDLSFHRIGILVYSIFKAYLHLTQSDEEQHASEWIGERGDKLETEVKIMSTRPFSHAYGTGTIVSLIDMNHNKLTWFSSKPVNFNELIGEKCRAKFKIKKHDEYKNQKITTITHFKSISIPS